MIDRFLKWLAQRPLSDRGWLEDIYGHAQILRMERQKRKPRRE